MSGFEVIEGGIFATMQDSGRYGQAHKGHCDSGALDEYAYLWGQRLLGKSTNAIELMSGLKLKALAETRIAITGANLDFKINSTSKPIWQTHFIKADDILSFEKRISGQRAYLAVFGGLDTPKVLGSYATSLRENIGNKLTKGDFLPYKSYCSTHNTYRAKPATIPDYEAPLTLQLLLGYQESYFSDATKEKLFTTPYEITLQSDRMGYRLTGEPITPERTNFISEGIAFGSVQIPHDGQPIILLKERQTIGGYPKIGTILPIDCFRLAQANINSKIRFKPIEIEDAQMKLRAFYSSFA